MIRKLLFPLVIVLMIGLVFSGCAKPAPAPAPAPSPAPAPEGPDEILIGSCDSVTGMYAGFAEGNVFGMELAVEDINKLGGVYVKEFDRKIPIRVVVVDTESDPIKTGTLAENLILHEKVHVFASPLEPPPTRAPVSTICERYKIPNISQTGPMESWLGIRESATPPWEFTWSTGYSIHTPAAPGDFRHDKKGYLLMEMYLSVMEDIKAQTNMKVAVYASDDSDGRADYMLYPMVLQDAGYDVIYEGNLGLFPMDTTDFSAAIKEWKDFDAEIIVGNTPGFLFGIMYRQCEQMDFHPKVVIAPRAALFYDDINAWGGDLPLGVGTEWWWDPTYKECPGFGDTTPESLYAKWSEQTGRPLNQGIATGYSAIQVLVDAIERAGTLDNIAINEAMGKTDLLTMGHRILFNEKDQFSRWPMAYGQWRKTNKPWIWECPITFSDHDFIPVTAEPIFPIPQ